MYKFEQEIHLGIANVIRRSVLKHFNCIIKPDLKSKPKSICSESKANIKERRNERKKKPEQEGKYRIGK